ncbi:MAG: phosphatidylserine/phosphatidylglycerophosphate/cardiolipin synthase family protein [Planctomycetes bacterium]|nr:phosphatidylserine/phosphatidylglycerophosphate/cardiolipin synthase family protein [Planctomycetota bacterium]
MLLAVCLCGCLWACGCTAFPTRSQQVWRSAIDYAYPDDPAGSAAFEVNLDTLTGSRTHAGTGARLLQNGDEAYPAMLALIAGATTRICLETYIVEADETTDTFFAALRDAAGRGVDVRILVDAAGYRRGLVAHLAEFTEAGVQARVFNPFLFSWTVLRGNNRDHRKILVVDGCHAVLGGINLSDLQAGDGISGWRDTALLVSGPVAADAEQVFAETWEQAGRGFVGKTLPVPALNPVKRMVDAPLTPIRDALLNHTAFQPPAACDSCSHAKVDAGPYQTETAVVRVVRSSPDHRRSPTYDLAILGVLAARERVDIACAYFVPPLGLRRALLRAAERGVRVRLLLPGVTDVTWVREIGMRYYGELLAAGVEIHEWPYPILHTKTMAVDGIWLTVGSANMDSRSYFLNYEACLAVTDPALAEAAHRQFDEDLRHAHQLTPADWLGRGARQRWRERLLLPLAGQY